MNGHCYFAQGLLCSPLRLQVIIGNMDLMSTTWYMYYLRGPAITWIEQASLVGTFLSEPGPQDLRPQMQTLLSHSFLRPPPFLYN